MIGRRALLAAQHDIAPGFRRRLDPRSRSRLRRIRASRASLARARSARAMSSRSAAGSPAARRARGFARGRRRRSRPRCSGAPSGSRAPRICERDLAARAEAGIDQPALPQARPARRRSPRDARSAGAARRRTRSRARPCPRGSRLRIRACSASGSMSSMRSSSSPPVRRANCGVAKRGIGVPEMQPAVGRRREAEYRRRGRTSSDET